jgi:tetratricopeptide (TPR) repeat protein
MTRSFRSTGLITLFAIFLCMISWRVQIASAQAQKVEIPPDSNYMYEKDRAVIDEIKAKETDSQKRADALVAWVKNNPRATRAIAYAAFAYGEVVSGILKSGDAQKALTMIQTFQTAAPADTSLVPLQMSAYYQAKNFAKAAEIGEKIYSEKPSLEMANSLYTIYGQMNPPNADKMLVYGEKLVAEVPIEKSYLAALQLAQIYAQRRNTDKALQYFTKVMDVYGDKVPTGYKEADWNAVRAVAFAAMAADSYMKKDYPKATELYTKVITFAPKTDELACQAWYYIGMAKWQGKDQKAAIEPFAYAYVIGKSLSPKAKDNLDNLWKAEHNDSLDGLDAVIAKAKSDLGIR